MPANFVRVNQTSINVAVRSSGERIVVSSPRVGIVTAGKVGPPGENADATFEWATQIFDLTESTQEFLLDFLPRAGSIVVYLNGLCEQFWSIASLTVTLEDSALEGDTVMVRYQKET